MFERGEKKNFIVTNLFFFDLQLKMIEVGLPDWKILLTSLIVLLVADFVWLGIVSPSFNVYPQFENIKIKYGLFAWAALALGHSFMKVDTVGEGFIAGCGIGFVSYAVFNGTELAIRSSGAKPWTVGTASIDLFWGTIANGAVGALMALLFANQSK